MTNRSTSLHRPEEGRWLAGVAAGLGLHFGVPVWVFRVGFALLCFVGGLGVLLYLAGWLLIPGEGQAESIVQGWVGAGQARRWVGVILVGIAVIILGAETALIRGDLAFAVVLIGIGVMLFRGDLSRGDPPPARQSPDQEASSEEAPEGSTASPPPAAAAALAPAEGGAQASAVAPPPAAVASPPPPKERSYLGRAVVGVAVLALGVLGLLDEVIPGFHPDLHHYVALALGVIGLGVAVGAWFGRPAGLVILGVVLIPVLLLSRLAAAGGADITSIEFGSAGQVLHRPASVEDIRETYELGVGGLIIDLRDIDFAGSTVTMAAEVGIGELVVRLPEGVAAEVSGEVGMGSLEVGDWDRGGIGVEADLRLEGSGGTLILDSEVGIGGIEIRAWPVDNRSPRGISEDEAVGEEYRIRDGAELGDHYTLSVGSLRLDLGEMVLRSDRRVPINVDRGEVMVTVPRDVSLLITTRVDRGAITMFDQVWEGANLKATHSTQIPHAARLTLDIRLGRGNVLIEEER
ncbi:MAG: PspC domain-containing protein [bacterium]|nr:PspC domain-containing protein [bacterium]